MNHPSYKPPILETALHSHDLKFQTTKIKLLKLVIHILDDILTEISERSLNPKVKNTYLHCLNDFDTVLIVSSQYYLSSKVKEILK